MKLTPQEFSYLGLCLESFLYGLYSAVFVLYLQHHASKNDTDRTKNILYYAVCVLYILSVATIVLDIIGVLNVVAEPQTTISVTIFYLNISSGTIFGCCDFIAESILIYRCWIVWGCNTRVVIVPSFLAIVFLALWLATNGSSYFLQGQFFTTDWGYTITLTSLAISMTVNALVVGLIVLKIFKVYWQVKATSHEQNMGATGGNKLRSIIFILIESGMAMFSIQLVRLVATSLPTDAAFHAYMLTAAMHTMLNGITPTIILVRVSMGLSFHDENSLVEATMSLCFAPDHPNSSSNSETGSILSIGRQESGDNDIQMIDR